jgi:hypothetical protein
LIAVRPGSVIPTPNVQTGSGTVPVFCPVRTGVISQTVKRPEREPDYVSVSEAENNNCVELYLYSPICLHGVVPN